MKDYRAILREGKLLYPALFLSSLFLLIPAFYNHYPLVNPDTATYLASGFKPETPMDRPITYGLLVRLFSLNGLSLWFVVFTQAFIVSWLIFRIVKELLPSTYLLNAVLIIFFLSIGSPLSWVVSQIQPDVCTSIALLVVAILLITKGSRIQNVPFYVLFFLMVAAHLSHPLLFVVLLICIAIFNFFFIQKREYKQTNKMIAILIIIALSSISIMGPALSKSRHIFLVGTLLEKGVLKKFLDDNCSANEYKLCAYKDILPTSSDQFIWNDNSPLYKIGSWQGTKVEFNKIIHSVFTQSLYLKMYLQATAKQFLQQAATFTIGDGNTNFPPGSNLNNSIAEYFPHELNEFNNAKENKHDLAGTLIIPNALFAIFVVLSTVVIIIFILMWRLTRNYTLLLTIITTGLLLNCLDCAAFSVVNGRYGCKMIWLLPFCASMCISQKLCNRKHDSNGVKVFNGL